jgi:hypothetical protein
MKPIREAKPIIDRCLQRLIVPHDVLEGQHGPSFLLKFDVRVQRLGHTAVGAYAQLGLGGTCHE